jgi:hypothetical protein
VPDHCPSRGTTYETMSVNAHGTGLRIESALGATAQRPRSNRRRGTPEDDVAPRALSRRWSAIVGKCCYALTENFIMRQANLLRTTRYLSRFALALICCADLWASPSSTAETRWQTLPPFTSDQFLKNLFRVIDKKDGYVSTPAFEQTFGVAFPHYRKESDGVWTRWLAAGEDYYFNVGVTHTDRNYFVGGDPESSGETSRLSIGFGNAGFGGASFCISSGLLRRELEARGWRTDTSWGLAEASGAPATPADVVFYKAAVTSLPRFTARSAGHAAKACVTSIVVSGRRSPL